MLILLLSAFWSLVSASESVTAELVAESTVLTTLSFSNEIQIQRNSFTDFSNFPPVIYQLAEKHEEGTISFTKGFWDDSLWSAPGFATKTSGFELELAQVYSEEDFKTSLNVISGYFCSSVSRIKTESLFVKQNRAFASLQQESLCTENLQPFFDLLPCRDVSGLASMLRPEVLHKSEYYSMQIHFQRLQEKITFNAKLYLVNNLNRWNRQRSKPKKNEEFSVNATLEYSLQGVLGKLPNGICKQASVNLFGKSYSLEGIEKAKISLPTEFTATKRPVRVLLFKSGVGDDEAGFGIKIENDMLEEATINVLLHIPWMFRPIWHEASNFKALNGFTLTPAKFDRKSSSFAELQFRLPGRSAVSFHVPFEREYLRLDEFPANSERGIDFPAAKIVVEGSHRDSFTANGLLFTWPIPDGTMPFNVVTMSATVMALFHGALFNMLTRRFYLRRPEDPPASPLLKFIWKLKRLIKK